MSKFLAAAATAVLITIAVIGAASSAPSPTFPPIPEQTLEPPEEFQTPSMSPTMINEPFVQEPPSVTSLPGREEG